MNYLLTDGELKAKRQSLTQSLRTGRKTGSPWAALAHLIAERCELQQEEQRRRMRRLRYERASSAATG